jgi:hypothetical protein
MGLRPHRLWANRCGRDQPGVGLGCYSSWHRPDRGPAVRDRGPAHAPRVDRDPDDPGHVAHPGAGRNPICVFARYSDLRLGPQVFTAGLADPNLWINRLFVTDLGINWYWNQYIRVLFDWQHARFGTPVVYAPGAFARTSDLFIVRFEIWF